MKNTIKETYSAAHAAASAAGWSAEIAAAVATQAVHAGRRARAAHRAQLAAERALEAAAGLGVGQPTEAATMAAASVLARTAAAAVREWPEWCRTFCPRTPASPSAGAWRAALRAAAEQLRCSAREVIGAPDGAMILVPAGDGWRFGLEFCGLGVGCRITDSRPMVVPPDWAVTIDLLAAEIAAGIAGGGHQ